MKRAGVAGPSAALSALMGGVQPRGPWIGRRQLVARFAQEAETAVMYTAAAFAGELERLAARSRWHSISLDGRDPLGNALFLSTAFHEWKPTLPVMVETDGQRPDMLPPLQGALKLVQVTPPAGGSVATMERALESLGVAAEIGCEQALVLLAEGPASDGSILRIVEQAHRASAGTMIVVHLPPGSDGARLDRRWSDLLEQASTLHADVRLLPTL